MLRKATLDSATYMTICQSPQRALSRQWHFPLDLDLARRFGTPLTIENDDWFTRYRSRPLFRGNVNEKGNYYYRLLTLTCAIRPGNIKVDGYPD
jgi:hypothetical protein